MSTPQEYWDACLIRVWRQNGRVLDALTMFASIMNKTLDEIMADTALLRRPPLGYPWTGGIRPFTHQKLYKIDDWLWGHAPEKDVDLLKKLAKSKYDTATTNLNVDKELVAAQRASRRQTNVLKLEHANYSKRNQATDWGVTKGSVKSSKRRR